MKSFSTNYFFNLTNGSGTVYFFEGDATYGLELWKSDGTEAVAVIVKDINAQGPDANPAFLTACYGKTVISV